MHVKSNHTTLNCHCDFIIAFLANSSYLILKVLAWEIYNMNQEFAKKAIIKSQWEFNICMVRFNVHKTLVAHNHLIQL